MCYVNGEACDYYYMYRNPSDTIKTSYQFGQLVEQKIPLYPKPCDLEVIIEALKEQYPDRITILEDCQDHYIGSIDDGGENSTWLTISLCSFPPAFPSRFLSICSTKKNRQTMQPAC